MQLGPVPVVSEAALAAGKRFLVLDSAYASLTGALSGGVVLVGFALALGATPLQIGLLAAIPFIAQVAQLPAIVLVERMRERKRIAVLALTIARLLIMALGLLPFVADVPQRLALLIAAQFAIASLGSFAACAVNSWLHQLVPPGSLGAFFGKRLLYGTSIACAGTLAAGWIVDHPPLGETVPAFSIAFLAAGVAGLTSSLYLARAPEPQMQDAGPPVSLWTRMLLPLEDRNFRQLLVMLAAWNVASNVAAPFLTVYLLQQLGYGLTTVTALWVGSQVANAMTLFLWGRLSDRFSNKAVLAVALPVYFACTLGLVFTRAGAPYGLQLSLLVLVHVVMGAASGGIGLATGNLGLKLAPQDKGTAYLAAVGLASTIAGGLAPILAGAVAEWFSVRQWSFVMRWVSPDRTAEVSVASFSHYEFLFALSALLGFYVMHALSRVREGAEVSERRVVQEFALEAVRTINQLSSIGGMLGALVPFQRLNERRRRARPKADDDTIENA